MLCMMYMVFLQCLNQQEASESFKDDQQEDQSSFNHDQQEMLFPEINFSVLTVVILIVVG